MAYILIFITAIFVNNIVLSQFEQQNIVAGDVCHVAVGFSARSYRTGFCHTEATIQSIEKRKDYLI